MHVSVIRDSMVDKSRELKNCNFVKTILMMLIVVYHSILFWQGNWFTKNPIYISDGLSLISQWLNSFHVYSFTLVSGYIFYYIRYEKGGYDKYSAFVTNKFKRLLVPYFCVALFWVIPVNCMFFEVNFNIIFEKFILATAPNQLWFLIMLFGLFVLFWPLADFFKKHNVIGIVVALGIYLVGSTQLLGSNNFFSYKNTCVHLVFFLVGFKIRQHGSGMLMKIPSLVWLTMDVGLFYFSKKLAFMDNIITKLFNLGLNFTLHIVGAIMAFVILQKIANIINIHNRFWNFLSKHSMGIYLFHQQIIYICIYLLNARVNPYLHSVINLVVSSSLSITISYLLIKSRITRVMIGEK